MSRENPFMRNLLYTEQTIHPFQITLNDNKEVVRIEEDNDNEEEDKLWFLLIHACTRSV